MERGRVLAATGIYAMLGAVAWGGARALGASAWHLPHVLGGTRWVSVPAALALGVATGVCAVALSRWIARSTRWGRALHAELQMGVAGLRARDVLPLAIASGVGEELFFRGALQAGLIAMLGVRTGWVAGAVLFGAVHVPWNRRLVSWTVTAGTMGVVFGGMYLATGELLAPIVAHAIINAVNLRALLTPERGGPHVVFRRLRRVRLA